MKNLRIANEIRMIDFILICLLSIFAFYLNTISNNIKNIELNLANINNQLQIDEIEIKYIK